MLNLLAPCNTKWLLYRNFPSPCRVQCSIHWLALILKDYYTVVKLRCLQPLWDSANNIRRVIVDGAIHGEEKVRQVGPVRWLGEYTRHL